MRRTMSPEQVVDRFTTKFGGSVSNIRIVNRSEGSRKIQRDTIWMTIPREILVDAVAELAAIDYPHLGVSAAVDCGETIEILYYMQIFFGGKHEEIQVNFTVPVPKNDPHIPTISSVIPGAVYTEREKQDMIGIIVDGIPDKRRIFLPTDFPDGIYPWRKDEHGIPDSMVKELWKVDRPTDRPAPPVSAPATTESCNADGSGDKTETKTPAQPEGGEKQ